MGTIVINEHYALKSDSMQWMICRWSRETIGSKKRNKYEVTDGKFGYYWKPIQYYPELPSAVRQLTNRMIRESDFNSVRGLAEAAAHIVALVSESFPDFNISIKAKSESL